MLMRKKIVADWAELAACECAPNVKVSLELLHALVNVERGVERGGAEVYPKAQQ